MIRKFEKNDINDVMRIWKNENIKAHQFIEREYWENNYNYVREILQKNNFIITSESIDKDTNEIEYIMTWVK
jgi:putative acetyltransferase